MSPTRPPAIWLSRFGSRVPKIRSPVRASHRLTPFCGCGSSIVYQISSPGRAGSTVRQVEPVAVAHPGAPHRPAVVVDRDRAVEDLVEAVAVDVAGLDAVLPLAVVLERRALVGPPPHLLELAVAQRPGIHLHQAVGAADDQDARRLAVEVGDAEHVAARAVAGRVGPVGDLAALDPVDLVDLACRSRRRRPRGIPDRRARCPCRRRTPARASRRTAPCARRPRPCRRRRDRGPPSARTRCRG